MRLLRNNVLQKNIVHLADSAKNEDVANKKHRSKLKIWSECKRTIFKQLWANL